MSFDNNSNEQQMQLEERHDDNQLQSKQEEVHDPEIDKVQQQYPEENIQQAEKFSKYIEENGIGKAFQIIFAEVLSKKIKEDTIFAYTAMRLRQIGNDVAQIKEKQSKK